MTDKAYAVPLHELLASVPREARLVIDDDDGMGTRFIPVGRYCNEAAEALRARLAQPEQEHSEQWWRHEVSNAYANGYEKGRASVKQPEQEIESDQDHVEDDGCPTEKAVLQRFWREHQMQEPVAWMHNFIDEVVIAHRPVDLDRHPDRWTPLYKDPTPCQTCEALARTVMMDQTYHDSVMAQHRKPPTQDLSAPLTVNGVPMYPQREWQGLTNDEIMDACSAVWASHPIEVGQVVAAILKEKNGF